MSGEVTKPQGQPRVCRAGSQCQGDTGYRDQSQLLSLRAFPGTHPANLPLPQDWAGHLSQQDMDSQGRGREGLLTPPSLNKSFYFLRKCVTKGTKAGIPAVPTGRDKNAVSTTLFSIRGDASTQNIESSLELKPFVSPSLIAGTFPTQLGSSCCNIDFYKILSDPKFPPLNLWFDLWAFVLVAKTKHGHNIFSATDNKNTPHLQGGIPCSPHILVFQVMTQTLPGSPTCPRVDVQEEKKPE